MKRYLILLLLVILGCIQPSEIRYYGDPVVVSHVEVYSVYVDKNFDKESRVGILEGIVQWNTALNGNMRIEVVDWEFDMEIWKIEGMGNRDWIVMKIDSGNAMVAEGDLGMVDSIGGNRLWIVGDRVSVGKVRGVLMHELGHLLGVRHGKGLMGRVYVEADYRCVDRWTAMEVGRIWGFGGMRYCY